MPLYKLQSPFGAATNALSQAAQTSSSIQRKETRRQGDDTLDTIRAGVGIAQGLMGVASGVGNLMHTSQKIEQTGMEIEDQKGINAAYEHIAKTVGQNGDISTLDGDPVMNTRYGTIAAGKFLGQRAQNAESRSAMLKKMAEGDDAFYQNTFRPLASEAQQAYSKGDMQRFGQIAFELSRASPFPYQYTMGQDGNFIEQFRSDEAGGFVDTGARLTPQQVMESINGMMQGEQKVLSGVDMKVRAVNPNFLAASARYRMGTIQGNAESMADPKRWIPMEKNGHTVYAIPQNRHDNYSVGTSYRIMDEKGGKSYMVNSMDELLDKGYVRADVKASLDKSRADVQTSNARAQAYERAGAKGGGAVTLSDRDRSILMKYSENEDGETDHGKAALLEAISMKTGMTPLAAIHSYDSSVKNAMRKGLSRADAERAVYSEYAKRLGGGGGEQPSRKEGEPKPQAQPQGKTAERISNAVNRNPDDQPQKPAAGIMLDPDVSAALEEDERLYGY